MATTIRIAADPYQKLSLLDDATQFEPAGSEPMQESAGPGSGQPAKPLPCISQVTTPQGKKPVLKAMLTTACERNCYYCPFRAGRNDARRVTFQPQEMASTYIQLHRADLVDGLFLSSGIVNGSIPTQDKLLDTADILRKQHAYRGYIHLKIMPGAEYDQIRQAMHLADRVSVNLEGPTPSRLEALAPKKDFWQELYRRLQWVSEIKHREHARASIVTQFVVGAVGDTDLEILRISEILLQQLGLRRSYYSAFRPVSNTPFDHLAPASPRREYRLYQASFLLRDYGWSLEDLPFDSATNLPLDTDPKVAWAEARLREMPIEINTASRQELLRIPGIGPISAAAILAGRRKGAFRELSDLRAAGVQHADKAAPFILCSGRRPSVQLPLF